MAGDIRLQGIGVIIEVSTLFDAQPQFPQQVHPWPLPGGLPLWYLLFLSRLDACYTYIRIFLLMLASDSSMEVK